MVGSDKPNLPDYFGNPWMANLEEISLPEPVPFTPQTVGWYLLAGLVFLGLGWLAWRAWKRWRANAYRRSALSELSEIEGLESLPALLKRVALVAYPRTEVADLTGDAWLGFLDGSLGSTDFTRGAGRLLPDIAYDPAAIDSVAEADTQDLMSLAKRWIRHHRAAPFRVPADN